MLRPMLFPSATRTAACVAALGLLLLAPGSADADIFQYTDADGVVHFTNKHPNATLATASS